MLLGSVTSSQPASINDKKAQLEANFYSFLKTIPSQARGSHSCAVEVRQQVNVIGMTQLTAGCGGG